MQFRHYGSFIQLTFSKFFLPVNCFLVEEDAELTLIDAAHHESADDILSAAQKLGKPITRIVLTHAHGDHMGAVDRLKQALPDVRILISERDDKLWKGNKELEPGEPQSPIRMFPVNWIRTKPDLLLRDGDTVGSLIAVHSPGHTPGSMSFLDTRSGVLFAGDAFQTKGGIAVSGTFKLLFPFPALATWNKQVALQSARKLRELAPSLLAVGHGDALRDPIEAMERAISEAGM